MTNATIDSSSRHKLCDTGHFAIEQELPAIDPPIAAFVSPIW